MKVSKTNAMRILDAKKIAYELIIYESKDGKIDGVSVAGKINKDPKIVFKTLVVQGTSKNLYVFIVPVEDELDLKKAAKAANEKKIEMIPVKDIQKWTGYIRGGCSPIGMKKAYPTFIDESAQNSETIIVSGGKIGLQMELKVMDLQSATDSKIVDLIK
ncbi:Cys-tRNA(Pro) deacylase [Robertmurraya yapensis]|uniref:Cys-tRNA(Pro)/Cys-tRNA(Cys) deacylase n=1 Tax=Bacillus yapensis TaxID=2492960 RepID=A0A431WC96_9BACI|nr:Cys-tRNA(Pro) deacylase [Bacillus yapensis]RTR33081.1 Cys-tRNA(Pro) deacylase [Bacillus yapensis]TKS96904.1 Cys-tRNA(Pro) deacylase [Bacillus yapensis]